MVGVRKLYDRAVADDWFGIGVAGRGRCPRSDTSSQALHRLSCLDLSLIIWQERLGGAPMTYQAE